MFMLVLRSTYLEKFLREKRNTADVPIIDIDYRFIIDFETFLRNHKPIDHQKPMNNNGVMKHLIRLFKMTTLALKLTWISKDLFKNYKFRYKKVETAFLTQSELNLYPNLLFRINPLVSLEGTHAAVGRHLYNPVFLQIVLVNSKKYLNHEF